MARRVTRLLTMQSAALSSRPPDDSDSDDSESVAETVALRTEPPSPAAHTSSGSRVTFAIDERCAEKRAARPPALRRQMGGDEGRLAEEREPITPAEPAPPADLGEVSSEECHL